jgi:hypothetical protein
MVSKVYGEKNMEELEKLNQENDLILQKGLAKNVKLLQPLFLNLLDISDIFCIFGWRSVLSPLLLPF